MYVVEMASSAWILGIASLMSAFAFSWKITSIIAYKNHWEYRLLIPLHFKMLFFLNQPKDPSILIHRRS